jgi:hypothetical protein
MTPTYKLTFYQYFLNLLNLIITLVCARNQIIAHAPIPLFPICLQILPTVLSRGWSTKSDRMFGQY